MGVAYDVVDFFTRVVAARDLQTIAGLIQSGDPMAFHRQGIGQEAGATTYIQNGAGLIFEALTYSRNDPGIFNFLFCPKQRHRIVHCFVPGIAQAIIKLIIDVRWNIDGHDKQDSGQVLALSTARFVVFLYWPELNAGVI